MRRIKGSDMYDKEYEEMCNAIDNDEKVGKVCEDIGEVFKNIANAKERERVGKHLVCWILFCSIFGKQLIPHKRLWNFITEELPDEYEKHIDPLGLQPKP